MALGKKLEEALKMKGIKPGTLATMTGISKNTIYSIIKRDNEKVNLQMIQQFADALGMELDYFLKADPDELLDQNEEKPTVSGGLTIFEQEFLDNFSALNDQNRHILLVISAALLRDQAKSSDSPATEPGK